MGTVTAAAVVVDAGTMMSIVATDKSIFIEGLKIRDQKSLNAVDCLGVQTAHHLSPVKQ